MPLAQFFLSALTAGALLGFTVWRFFLWAGSGLSIETPTAAFPKLVDRAFGPRPFSRRSLGVFSAISPLFGLVLFCTTEPLYAHKVEGPLLWLLGFGPLTLASMCLALLPNYLCLAKSRILVNRFLHARSFFARTALLLADLAASILLSVLGSAFLATLVSGGSNLRQWLSPWKAAGYLETYLYVVSVEGYYALAPFLAPAIFLWLWLALFSLSARAPLRSHAIAAGIIAAAVYLIFVLFAHN